MNIPLKQRSQRFIKSQVSAGRYETPEEVVQAGLELLAERNKSLAEVRRKIAIGMEQARRGELLDGDAVFDEVFGASGKTRSRR